MPVNLWQSITQTSKVGIIIEKKNYIRNCLGSTYDVLEGCVCYIFASLFFKSK